MAKSRCFLCKNANCIKMQCKFCDNKFCTSCLLPEKHKCINLIDCEQLAKKQLDDELYKNKCISQKIIKI